MFVLANIATSLCFHQLIAGQRGSFALSSHQDDSALRRFPFQTSHLYTSVVLIRAQRVCLRSGEKAIREEGGREGSQQRARKTCEYQQIGFLLLKIVGI